MLIINSLKNPLIKNIKKLALKKYRSQQQAFIVEGWHLVAEALVAKRVKTIVILDDAIALKKMMSLKFSDDKITILKVTNHIITTLSSNKTPQPILAVCTILPPQDFAGNNILVLDNIQDPNNLGAILRSCTAFGVNCIILSNDSVDLYNSKVINASQGAIFKVNCVYVDIIEIIKKLKSSGYYLFGTVLKPLPTKTLAEIVPKLKNAFIFGNEGRGIRKELYPYIDENFLIPITSATESLNLAISVAITFYHLFINY